MPTCDHCDEAFDDETAYLEHLRDEHEGDLGRIERRRVEELGSDDGGTRRLVYGAWAVGSLIALVVAVVLLTGGGGGSETPEEMITPTSYGAVHGHGYMVVSIEGDRLDFSRNRYQLADRYFHFESGKGEVYHTHGERVTLEYALDTLGIGVTNDSVTFQGTTYDDDDPNTNVSITVDGEPVEPRTYVLEGAPADRPGDGDFVRVIVETTNASG